MIRKDSKPSNEIATLREKFGGVPEARSVLAFKLINEIEFMQEIITEQQASIREDGVVVTSTNGNGFTTKQEHPSLKSYNTTVKNYLSCIKQLNDLLPDAKTEGVQKAGDALKKFIEVR